MIIGDCFDIVAWSWVKMQKKIVQLESKESLQGREVQQAATAEDGAPRQHFSSHCW